jgi:hypothetical protein
MTDIINQTTTFRLLEERIAKTTNPRHLLMLKRLLQHATAEAKPDLDLVMSTLCANPRYITWGAPQELSPIGRQAVHAFYEETVVKGGQFFFEMDMDRIVVDDDAIVTEGYMRTLYTVPTRRKEAFPLMIRRLSIS